MTRLWCVVVIERPYDTLGSEGIGDDNGSEFINE